MPKTSFLWYNATAFTILVTYFSPFVERTVPSNTPDMASNAQGWRKEVPLSSTLRTQIESTKDAFWVIFADGACQGNPGPGGWGALVCKAGETMAMELWGAAPQTTNNRMEITGALRGLMHVLALAHQENSGPAVVYSDSQYVVKGMTQWIINWQKNNWRTSGKKPVENQSFWQALLEAEKRYIPGVQWRWVPGHKGHEGNEYADMLARRALGA